MPIYVQFKIKIIKCTAISPRVKMYVHEGNIIIYIGAFRAKYEEKLLYNFFFLLFRIGTTYLPVIIWITFK